MNSLRQVRIFEWGLGSVVTLLAVIAWWQQVQPLRGTVDIYNFFPLLGLIAFSLIWTHFIIGAVARAARVRYERGFYSVITMGMVLALIILHPSLLSYGLYRDGFGLPPGSLFQVYQADIVAIIIAEISLAIFLAYELKRKFAHAAWWKYLEAIQGVAMVGIFYHSLTLGSTLQQVGWYRGVWWLYGITLVVSVAYVWSITRRRKQYEIEP
jgi:hypothetical protein